MRPDTRVHNQKSACFPVERTRLRTVRGSLPGRGFRFLYFGLGVSVAPEVRAQIADHQEPDIGRSGSERDQRTNEKQGAENGLGEGGNGDE